MPSVSSPPTDIDTVAPARRCAYTVLRRVFEQGAYADRALHGEAAGLDPRDRALAMRLAYGAVQRKGTLDHLIELLADRPVSALDPPVLAALRLGLYELLYLQGAPDYAVVADAVELAKAHGARRSRPRQRRAAPRRARRARRAARDAQRRHAGAGRRQALPPRVDRAPVVGRARPRGRPRADGRRQRAGGGGAACEHARHRRPDARRAAARRQPLGS